MANFFHLPPAARLIPADATFLCHYRALLMNPPSTSSRVALFRGRMLPSRTLFARTTDLPQ